MTPIRGGSPPLRAASDGAASATFALPTFVPRHYIFYSLQSRNGDEKASRARGWDKLSRLLKSTQQARRNQH